MNIVLKIKRRENKFYDFLYRSAYYLMRFNFPMIKPIHLPLYYLSKFIQSASLNFIHSFWTVPLFKSRCESVGKELSLPNGMPLIIGHLNIYLGDNVTIMRTTIGSNHVGEKPVLKIGNNSSIGYGTVISITKEILIGNNSMIAPHCLIMDSDDHPINPSKRLTQISINEEDAKPVRIGNNVWVCDSAAILKGVTIGDGSIIATRSVVRRDVPPNTIVAGNPARPTKRDIHLL